MSETNIIVNYLSPLGYRMVFDRTPQLVYDLQSVLLPEISLGDTETFTPFASIPQGGDHIQYGYLPMTFKIDENMVNYGEILEWMQGLAPPIDFDEAKAINDPKARFGRRSDGILTILTAENIANIYFYFRDLVPLRLSLSTPFDTTKTDVQYITGSCLLKYSWFRKVNDLSLLTK